MKRFEFLPRPSMALALAATFAAFANHANAERIFYESFETPVVLEGATDPDGWEQGGGHPSYRRAANEAGQNWSTPYGEQGMGTYSNGIGLKYLGYMPAESGLYILKFNVTSGHAIGEYRAEILTEKEFLGGPLPETLVAHTAGDTDGSKDMSFSGTISWRYEPEFEPEFGEVLPIQLKIKLMQDPLRANWRSSPIWDNVSVDFIPDVDTTGPTLVDIVDDNQGGLVVATNSLVTYTVTFNEAMDASTVNTDDFGNAGGSDVTIESVTTTSDPAVFLVGVRPSTEGTLRLEIVEGADLQDLLTNSMETVAVALQDDVTFYVEAGTPTLLPSDIVDDRGGAPCAENTLLTYTVTFSKDMNATTVTNIDFGNAGTAPITIGTITETTPGVFTVEVTPIGSGTLQFQVNQGVIINAADGGELNTTNAIADDTTIVVDSDLPTLFEFTNDAGGSPVVVDTLVTYDVFFSEDMDASTVDASDFGNAVTTGNAPFTIHSVEEASPGVFRIELTPTGPGEIQLQVNAGAVLKDVIGNALATTTAIEDDTTLTVSDTDTNPYETWAGGAIFDVDANGDGVASGMAWMLGAAGPSANAINLQPVASRNGGDLVLTFRCLNATSRGGALLKVQYSRDMGQNDLWHDAEVPDSNSTVNNVVFVTTADGDYINVTATIPASAAAPGTKLFARLSGASAP